jgi:hypothetical protein
MSYATHAIRLTAASLATAACLGAFAGAADAGSVFCRIPNATNHGACPYAPNLGPAPFSGVPSRNIFVPSRQAFGAPVTPGGFFNGPASGPAGAQFGHLPTSNANFGLPTVNATQARQTQNSVQATNAMMSTNAVQGVNCNRTLILAGLCRR